MYSPHLYIGCQVSVVIRTRYQITQNSKLVLVREKYYSRGIHMRQRGIRDSDIQHSEM